MTSCISHFFSITVKQLNWISLEFYSSGKITDKDNQLQLVEILALHIQEQENKQTNKSKQVPGSVALKLKKKER